MSDDFLYRDVLAFRRRVFRLKKNTESVIKPFDNRCRIAEGWNFTLSIFALHHNLGVGVPLAKTRASETPSGSDWNEGGEFRSDVVA
jgi:hypothetical protein